MLNRAQSFFIPITLLVLLIWLPFGFGLTGLIEEWGALSLFATKTLSFVVTPSVQPSLAAHSLRPLTVLPHAIAYFIDSDSFNVWHVLEIVMLIIKGVSSSYIAWALTRSRVWALFFGVLVVLYPADTMQLSFRAIHINYSIALLLAATAIHFSTYEIASNFKRNLFAVITFVLLSMAIFMYEAALILSPIVFFVMFAKDDIRQGWQNFCNNRVPFFAWLLAPFLYVAYVALFCLLNHHTTSYQHRLVEDLQLSEFIHSNLPKLYKIGVFRSLFGGWFDAISITFSEFKSYTYIFFSTVMGISFWIVCRKSFTLVDDKEHQKSDEWRFIFRLLVAGMVLLILGYIPFLFSSSHLHISQRTFLFATPGAALVILGFLQSIAKLNKSAAIVCSIFLMITSFGAQMYQFNHYMTIANAQKKVLRNIMENFNGKLGDKTLLILDRSASLHQTWMLGPNLKGALRYIYNEPIERVRLCLAPENKWDQMDSLARKGDCIKYKDKWGFKLPTPIQGVNGLQDDPPQEKQISNNKLVVLTINSDYSINKNPLLNTYRAKLKTGKDHASLRYQRIFSDKSWPLAFQQFKSDEVNSYYRWDAGKWWNLDIPIHGVGWREVEWHVNYFYHRAAIWKNQELSTMLFEISPLQSLYVLHGKFTDIVSEDIRKSMQLHLNKHALALVWKEDGEFEAKIPMGVLISGINKLEFISLVDVKMYGLAAKLNWYEISPAIKL